jgi:hypothetical protein
MRRLLILIPFLVATGCELVVDVDVPDNGPQLTIACLAPSDSSWRVDIWKAMNILENPFTGQVDSVTNAIVTITDQTTGSSVVLEREILGRYRSDEGPIAGHLYSIKVEVDGYPDVTATTIAPDAIEFTHVEMDTSQTVFYEMRDYFPAKITFNDPPGVRNTYELEVFTKDSLWMNYDPQKEPYWLVTGGFSLLAINDPALPDKEDVFRTTPYPRRFGDETFDGEEKTVTVLIPRYVLNRSTYTFGIRFYNQGYELGKFVDDRTLQYNLQGYPFTQPVPVYSNVSNRNGIFAIKTASMIEWNMGPVWKPE